MSIAEQETTSLSQHLRDVLADVITGAVHQEMTALAQQHAGPDVPTPLHWSADFDHIGRVRRIVGLVPGKLEPRDVPEILAGWAQVLGLTRSDHAHPGSLHYTGLVDDQPVRVWGIVDPETWRNQTITLGE